MAELSPLLMGLRNMQWRCRLGCLHIWKLDLGKNLLLNQFRLMSGFISLLLYDSPAILLAVRWRLLSCPREQFYLLENMFSF